MQISEVARDRATHKAHGKDQDGSTFIVKYIIICNSIRLCTLIREGGKYKEKAGIAMQNESGRVSFRVWALNVLLTIAATKAAKTRLTTCTFPSPPSFPRSVTRPSGMP